jgi:hypothetical protein
MLVNLYNDKVIDVSGNKDREGQKIIAHGAHGRVNQRWSILYLSDKKKDTTKHNFGFRVNTPFYIES